MAIIEDGTDIGGSNEPENENMSNTAAKGFGATGDHVSFDAFEPEQAKTLPEVTNVAAPSRRQRRGKKRAGAWRAKGVKTKARVARLRKESQRAGADHDVARGDRPPRSKIRLPHWLPFLWVPVVVWLLSRIEKRFVSFLPGLIPIAGFLSWFIAGVVEAAAWWLGRSLAARHEARAPVIQLKDSEKYALRFAAKGVIAMQIALFVLRLIRTGQLTASIALTLAALILFGISTWVHDCSTEGGDDDVRRTGRSRNVADRRLTQALGDFSKQESKHHRIVQGEIIEPAMAKVAEAADMMSGVDALVRERGRSPKPWPIPLALQSQLDLAHGRVPGELQFPTLDDIDPDVPARAQPPELGAGS